jgi:N-sulfoglucosamine sulfohydrolase
MRSHLLPPRWLAAALALCACILAALGAEAKRPNILFLFADDWGRYASCYAKVDGPGTLNDVIQTPNFDRLAREGVLFKNAHVTAPSCTPCRSSLLSGQYFFRTHLGAILRGAHWDDSIPAYPLLLRAAGYHIGKTYKVWSPGTPADAPYGTNAFNYASAGGRFNQFSVNVAKMVAAGQPLAAAKQELFNEVTGNFDAFLAARPAGQPFCYWFGPTLTHRKWQRGSGKAQWGIEPDRLKGKVPAFLPDVPEIREDLADYLGLAQAFDTALGLFLKKLEAMGELDNTIIAMSGDHGAPGFTHGKCNLYDFGTGVSLAIRGPGVKGGRVVDDFVNLMDLAPTFLEVGGVKPPAVMTGRSLVPVLASTKSGLVDPARTWVITGRERHVEDAREGYVGYPQRSLRTKDFLYIINFKPDRWPMGDPKNLNQGKDPSLTELIENTRITLSDMDSSPTKAWLITHREDTEGRAFYDYAFAKRPEEELYATTADPHQVKNLAADPKFADVRAKMRKQLLDELKRVEDPRVSADPKFDKPPFVGPVTDDAAGKAKGKGGRKKAQ